jgi:hypothetical protein
MNITYVVADGNAFDGIELFGPFENEEDATMWAEYNCGEWHVLEVGSVEYSLQYTKWSQQ